MNSSDNIGRFAVAAAVICSFLVFGAAGAQAASKHAVAASGPFAQASSDNTGSDSQTPSDEPSSDNSDQNSDSDTTDSDTTDSDSNQPTDEPTDEPTFTGVPTTGTTDDSTEMPTDATGQTSESGQSPLGWILLGGGVVCAVAAFLVFRRNRHIM